MTTTTKTKAASEATRKLFSELQALVQRFDEAADAAYEAGDDDAGSMWETAASAAGNARDEIGEIRIEVAR